MTRDPLRELTLMYWSACRLHRAPDRSQRQVKPTLWHVARNSTGALRTRAIAVLKEIINGR